MTDGQIDKIENIIGYKFRNKTLLVNAFTHVSYINEHKNCESYEKLEFLGDSILNFIVADKLYHAQLRDEGEMTMLRARMVSRSPLAEAVKRMDLCPFVRLGKGAEKCDTMPVKIQSDIFESVLAAIYLDSGSMTEAKTFVDKHLSLSFAAAIDYRSRLQEYAQARKITLEYDDPVQKGDQSHPYFIARAVLDNKITGHGEGGSKKEAQQNAAKEIYDKLEHERNT